MTKGKIRGATPINRVMFLAVIFNTLLLLGLSALMLVTRFNSVIVQTATQSTASTGLNAVRSIDAMVSEKLQTLDKIGEIIETEGSGEKLRTVMELNSDIVSITTYDEQGQLLFYTADGSWELKNYGDQPNLSFDTSVFDSEEEYYISPPHVNNLFVQNYPWVVTFTMPIQGNDRLLYVAMDIEFSKISQYIDKISIGDRGYLFLASSDGGLVYHPQQQLIYCKLKTENIEVLPQTFEDGTVSADGKIYAASAVSNTDWYVVGVSDVDELVTGQMNEYIRFFAIVLSSGLLVSLLVSAALLGGLTNPIRRLMDANAAFEQDITTDIQLPDGGFREIQALNNSFIHMSQRIKRLMERVVAEEQELKKVELNLLQNQINPHFLYNTLDSIFWMCQKNGNEDASEMVSALANTFRISISRGKDVISVREELKHVDSYLTIQTIRYKNQFSYTMDVEDEILDYRCLKILLQPFVENAIYHGLDRMVDEGEIHISGRLDGGNIILQVADNGIGMTPEEVDALFLEDNQKVGVGVKNVHNRLSIYYGEGYGVSIASEPDEGTTVTLTIPAVKGEG